MLTNEHIKFLNRVCEGTWTERNGVISVNGNVDMDDMNLTKIPVQFGRVIGYFNCSGNKLTSLLGCPSIVDLYFDCDSNQLTTLEGGPTEVAMFYSCSYNELINLISAPEICNNFYCYNNQLTSLEGCPKLVKGDLRCESNSALSILFGLRVVEGIIQYDNTNDLNEWIIKRSKINIFSAYEDIATWIKLNNRLEFLRNAQPEIQRYFSDYIIKASELNLC